MYNKKFSLWKQRCKIVLLINGNPYIKVKAQVEYFVYR